jgi:hypothetical protein
MKSRIFVVPMLGHRTGEQHVLQQRSANKSLRTTENSKTLNNFVSLVTMARLPRDIFLVLVLGQPLTLLRLNNSERGRAKYL